MAAALAESSRQVEALRLLYNEELSRASRLAVELSRATAAADKATAAEDGWKRQLQKSDSRADNAEGMASAMKVAVKQLEEELAQERSKLEAKNSECSEQAVVLAGLTMGTLPVNLLRLQSLMGDCWSSDWLGCGRGDYIACQHTHVCY